MSTSYQGAPGTSGYESGLRLAPIQPVSGNRSTSTSADTVKQSSQEQRISNQIRKLTVMLLVNMFCLRVNANA